jgi:hypothetical protein
LANTRPLYVEEHVDTCAYRLTGDANVSQVLTSSRGDSPMKLPDAPRNLRASIKAPEIFVAKQRRTVETDRSLPAGKDPHGTPEPSQPDSTEQSGSTGRRTDTQGKGTAADTGQGRYGQTGLGGKRDPETIGQARYRRSGPDGGHRGDTDSNEGSGRPDVDSKKER